jgi:hypothetical protein
MQVVLSIPILIDAKDSRKTFARYWMLAEVFLLNYKNLTII